MKCFDVESKTAFESFLPSLEVCCKATTAVVIFQT